MRSIRTDIKILIVEDGGRPIHVGLKSRDPSRPEGCLFGDANCFVDPSIQCDRTGVVYRITCKQCDKEVMTDDTRNQSYDIETHNYVGMTRCSLHSRMMAHLKGQSAMSSKRPLYRHDTKCHGGETQKYNCTILATESKIVRLNCNEALRIEQQNPQYTMNERNEGGRGGIVRLTVTRVTH